MARKAKKATTRQTVSRRRAKPRAKPQAKPKAAVLPTAAVLVIGNEILSGRTHDANLHYLGRRLAEVGVRLKEARVVEDDTAAIGAALNALRRTHTYVFTTGGIGPTHDDITAESVAKALKLPLITDKDALARLEAHYRARGGIGELNAARRRMAHMPKGSVPIDNPVSAAPGFRIKNVFVFAGVPLIAQAMFEGIARTLRGGPPLLSRTVRVSVPEGEFAAGLGDIQSRFPDVEIGSYPSFTRREPGVRIVLRSTDPRRLDAAVKELDVLIVGLGGVAEEIVVTAPAKATAS